MEYKLIEPIKKVDGEIIKKVEIKEKYQGRDVRQVLNSKGEGDAEIKMVAAAIGVSETTVDNMDARDVVAIAKVAKPFFAPGEN